MKKIEALAKELGLWGLAKKPSSRIAQVESDGRLQPIRISRWRLHVAYL